MRLYFRPVINLVLIVLVLSSCTDRRYSHMPFRYNLHSSKKESVAKEERRKTKVPVEHTAVRVEDDSHETSLQILAGGSEKSTNHATTIVRDIAVPAKTTSSKERAGLTYAEPVRAEPDRDLNARTSKRLHSKFQKKVEKLKPGQADDEIAGLLYIILVLLLILIILGLVKAIVGPVLWSLIILVAVFFLLGMLLGWW